MAMASIAMLNYQKVHFMEKKTGKKTTFPVDL
jgi:hypothetical protein